MYGIDSTSKMPFQDTWYYYSTNSDESSGSKQGDDDDNDDSSNIDYILDFDNLQYESSPSKTKKRRMRNAASAKRSRAKKRAYVADIEQKLSSANVELEALRSKTHDLENRLRIVNKDRERILTELADAVVALRKEKEKGAQEKAGKAGEAAPGVAIIKEEKLLFTSPIFGGAGVGNLEAIESHFLYI